jgi:nitrogen fixation NifU-like protein
VAWTAEGCSISQASTSVLHDLAVEGPAEQARRGRSRLPHHGSQSRHGRADEELLGDAAAFAGVGRHTSR